MPNPSPIHVRIHTNRGGAPGPLEVAFDDVVQRLEAIPRMFIELDGSFVWRTETSPPFQWDGEVTDSGATVQFVELRGHGREALEILLACFADSPDKLLVESVWDGDMSAASTFLASMPSIGDNRDPTNP